MIKEVAMIEVKNLFLKFTREYYALYDVNMNIEDGESVAFIGEDESGKTSLLRIFAKLEKMTKGEVYIKDIPLDKLDYRTDISAGYIPSTPVFLEKKTVYENFKYILKAWGMKEADVENKINEIIHYKSIKPFRIKKPIRYEGYRKSKYKKKCTKIYKNIMQNSFKHNQPLRFINPIIHSLYHKLRIPMQSELSLRIKPELDELYFNLLKYSRTFL